MRSAASQTLRSETVRESFSNLMSEVELRRHDPNDPR